MRNTDHHYTDEPPPYDDDPGNVVNIAAPTHHNLPAERALLGALLLEPTQTPTILNQLNPDDFYDPRHQQIYEAITHIAVVDGLLPDHILLTTHLATTGQLTKLAHLLPDLTGACPTPSQAPQYAQTITTTARTRRIHTGLTRATQLLNTATPHTIDTRIAEIIQQITDDATTFTNGAKPASTINYLPFDGLFSKPRTPVQWVTAPILAKGRVSLMYSPGKTGKSLIAMEAAAAIATGRPALLTDTPAPPQHVLYIDQEMTEDDWIDRLSDMGYDTTDEAHLAHYLHLAQLQSWPAMDTAAGGQAVEQAAQQTGAQVVIIDTASKVIAGEENANDTQQAFYRHTLVPLKRAGIAVLVLDHTGKDLERGARGASAKTDNIDLAFELLQRGKDLLTLRCTHARVRDEHLEDPTFLRRQVEPLLHRVELIGHQGEGAVRPTHLMEMVSRYVQANPTASKNQIETAVKGKRDYVRLALELLVAEQYIRTESGPRNIQTHHHIRTYLQEEDTHD